MGQKNSWLNPFSFSIFNFDVNSSDIVSSHSLEIGQNS